MTKFVIKRDGAKEAFDAEKIRKSVAAAGRDANLPQERINELAEQVSKKVIEALGEKEEISTSEIREKILSELDIIEPAASGAWRKYNSEKKGIK